MKFSVGVLAAITPMAALAFLQPTALRHSTSSTTTTTSTRNINHPISENGLHFGFRQSSSSGHHEQNKAMSELKMAFKLKEGETSNMFDGPAPLVKERDACGVGFIANTQAGGKEVNYLFGGKMNK